MSTISSGDIGTFALTNANSPFVINAEDGVTVVAMKLLSGSGSYQGSMVVNGYQSGPISLVVNDPVTLSQQNPLNTVTIVIDPGSLLVIITGN